MKTKLSILEAAAADGRWRDALRIAASFPRLGDHGPQIVRGHEAFSNKRFYEQIGKDPDQLIKDGISALCERYNLKPDPQNTDRAMSS